MKNTLKKQDLSAKYEFSYKDDYIEHVHVKKLVNITKSQNFMKKNTGSNENNRSIAYSVKWKSENPSLDSNPRPFLLVRFELFDFSHNTKYFYL